ncbi:MAG TPA: PAS domain-containing protein, partial [Gemmatimonadaceae bacterium]|nr:PAS domain-containing protein [Gemmatimonadaceae bacterium]
RASEAHYRSMLDSLPVLVYHAALAPSFTPMYVNGAVETLGFTREEWLTEPDRWLRHLHPDDRDRVLAGSVAAAARGESVDLEYRMISRDGSVLWFHDRGSFLRDADGRVTAWRGIMIDITARKSAEEALRRSEERFRLAGRATNDVIWDWDVPTGRLAWGDAITAVFGYPQEEISDSIDWWTRGIHPADRDRVVRGIHAVLDSGGTMWNDEYRFRRRDGSFAAVLDRGHVARDAEGTAIRMVGSMIDLTEQLETASALRLQGKLLQTVQQGVLATDIKGRVTFVNRAAVELLGWTEPEIRGRVAAELVIPPESAAAAAEAIACITEKKSWSGEIAMLRKDATTFVAHLTGSPIEGPDGRIHGFVGVVSDVSERHALEEQLRQSQKMEAIGRLAGGVAHDFNNLLTIIQTNAEFLLEDLGQEDPRSSDVLEIRNATERAAGLTRQLLAFSRKQLLQPRPLDIEALIGNLQPMLSRLIAEDIRIETRLRRSDGCIMADPGQLEQVLLNLVVNARDAMPDGGRILIETADIELDGSYVHGDRAPVIAGTYRMIAVSDTGIGMAPEIRDRVFDPFFTTKPVGKGTGLGLATVYGIVKQSGGHIWVYSEPGIGTTFKLYFPRLSAAAAPGAIAVPRVAAQGGSETVLVVEDEAGVRASTTRILRRQGYEVLESGNGAEALAFATEYAGQIDLVLTDVVMPGLSGPALMERIKAVRPGVATLFMSGYTDDDIVRRGVLTPGRAFLQKPFTPARLLDLVRMTLDRRS